MCSCSARAGLAYRSEDGHKRKRIEEALRDLNPSLRELVNACALVHKQVEANMRVHKLNKKPRFILGD